MLTLTAGNALTIGTMDFADFVFTDLGVVAGTYTLFDTSQTIKGSLGGGSLTGAIGSFNATLSFDGRGQDILLALVAAASPSGPGHGLQVSRSDQFVILRGMTEHIRLLASDIDWHNTIGLPDAIEAKDFRARHSDCAELAQS